MKNNKINLQIPIDGKIYDRELFAHVLKGRLLINPEIPLIKLLPTRISAQSFKPNILI